jgi:Uma2 family endonuclease
MQWSEVIQDPTLRNLPYKIELNEFGKIEMSPASNHHAIQQARLVRLLASLFVDGEIASECSVATRLGVKVADVVWMSSDFLQEHEEQTPYQRAPELCIEILSPSNSDVEMQEKIALYLEHGAQEVWIVAEDNSIAMYGEKGHRSTSCFTSVEGAPSISKPEKTNIQTRERE